MRPGSVVFGSYRHGVFQPDVPSASEQAAYGQLSLPFGEGSLDQQASVLARRYHPSELPTHLKEAIRDTRMGSGNPKDLIGDTKPQLHLNPQVSLLHMAKVFELGAKKYGPYNWRKNAVRSTVYLSAAMRHLAAFNDGEAIDPESGQPHAAHVMACMAIVMDASSGGNLIDDRELGGKAADVIASLTEKRA